MVLVTPCCSAEFDAEHCCNLHQPTVRSITLCPYCMAVLFFTGPFTVRTATNSEIADLGFDRLEFMRYAQCAINISSNLPTIQKPGPDRIRARIIRLPDPDYYLKPRQANRSEVVN